MPAEGFIPKGLFMSWQHYRARHGILIKHGRSPDDPEVLEAKHLMRVELWTERVEKLIADAPPLSEDRRTRIAALLLTAGGA